ncbi:DNA-processing protein DprA [Phaeobacter gallaeciensis]|uniref:DNA-processing protein DprA n=1 Tax=Phaeobacter gallaeciensis TaxID=60890 RepID=UPI00237F3495|nr:DNA-processing protein DprA [Phaeobacter gallaeciensis]MDE4302444.1 DNA-processing protein DprA [Phaeobacter gallaeciensis]MDE4306578.1 DNA-processing protein DprA [Phaeobacter gallaeciensis]MDE4311303.1 DNA-processing protein DprA [Phaeobacter gallaeciensis]MDE4315766.1 DNA-processing protein DprA [Phaeobacter gallaeciensis]MDE4320230.1 DNA-processing protein DprA [Phaeobacter gallaeciensis]
MTEEAYSSTHPPLPPTTEDLRRSWLRLLRSRRVGPATFYRLLSEHGSAQNALEALPKMARSAGLKGYEICPSDAVDAEINVAKAAKARLLCFSDPEYPAPLAHLKDAPPALWAIGDLSLLQRPMIAIVGARNASSLGTRMARALAHDLGAAGYVVVSGLARGVDTAAHLAALPSGTIAVMAGGADVIYPSENTSLGKSIGEQGLILSEQPMGLAPQARHFPKRNRIIAGLAQAIVVVEAAAKSGSLITARDALDLGREVLAVPGHPFDARASGCNMLIRDGAQLVRNAADVIAALPPVEMPAPLSSSADQPDAPPANAGLADLPTPPPERRSLRETAALHQQVLARLGPSPTPEDQLLQDLSVAPNELSSVLTELELDGAVDRHPGGMLSRPPGRNEG